MKAEHIQLLAHLEQFISEHKIRGVESVLNQRTRHLTVVLEDIFQSQNASAVIRTCECMGLQDIHIIEQISKYSLNPRVLKGANKWMTFYQYNDKRINNTKLCYDQLREKGYHVLATDPSEDGKSIHEIDFMDKKIAIVFGNELRGVSSFGIEYADQKVRIPMYGFTESLNISVSVAICLNSLLGKLHQQLDISRLSVEDRMEIKLDWYRKIVRRSDLIEREFLRTNE
jgi:tRNA (guanosine-2'-O-)-methyltransferase